METKRQGQWLSVGRSLQEEGTYDANTYKLGLIIGKKRSRANSHKLIPTNRIRTEVLKVYPLKNIPKIRLDTSHKRISYEKFQERKFDVFPMWIELRLMPYEPKSILPGLWRRSGKPNLFHSKMDNNTLNLSLKNNVLLRNIINLLIFCSKYEITTLFASDKIPDYWYSPCTSQGIKTHFPLFFHGRPTCSVLLS